MRRISLVLAAIMAVTMLLAACGGKKNAAAVVKDLDQVVGKMSSYQGTGRMTLHTGQQPQEYQVEVWYQQPSFYRIKLTNEKQDITQIVLRNNDGVFVLTPHLNKSFRFQSNWPENQGQVYLYQSLAQSIIADNDRQFTTDKGAYVFDVVANYQNSALARQKIWLDQKSLAPRQVQVSDSNANVMVELNFTAFEFGTKFDKDSFDMQRNMTSMTLPQNQPAAKQDNQSAAKAGDSGKTAPAGDAVKGTTQGTAANGTPQGTAKGEASQGTPAQGTASQSAAAQGTTAQGTAAQGAAKGGTAQGTAAQGTTAQGSATTGTTTQGAIGQDSSAKGTGTQGASTQGTATQGTATQGTATQGTATQGTAKGSATQSTTTQGTANQGTGTQGTSKGTSAQGATKSTTGVNVTTNAKTATPGSAATGSAAAGSEKQAASGSLDFGIITPSYTPKGVKQQDEAQITLGGEKAILLRYAGTYNYNIVELKPEARETYLVPGDIVDLGYTIAVLSGDQKKTLIWTYDGVEYRLSTANLPLDEMIHVAQSVQGQLGK